MAVKFKDALDIAKHVRRPETTADMAVYRFYKKNLRENHPKLSLVEHAAVLPSPFSIEQFLKEVSAVDLKSKLVRQLHETCRVRLANLKGVIP